MRRTLGLLSLAAALGSAAACFTTGPQSPEVGAPGPATGDKDHTLEYWGKVREVLQLRTETQADLRRVSALVRKQADTIRRLPVDGVDTELVIAANAVAQSQEKQLKTADAADYSAKTIRLDPDLKREYVSAGQQTTSALANLKDLAAKLSARYRVSFPPIEETQK